MTETVAAGPPVGLLTLSNSLSQLILSNCLTRWPEEACGLLLGHKQPPSPGRTEALQPSWVCSAVLPTANVAEGDRRGDRFEIDPKVRFDVERAARQGGPALIGHFHSHPNGSPMPSPTDLARAYEPGLIWLIVGLDGTAAGTVPHLTEMRAYRAGREAQPFEMLILEAAFIS